MRQNGDPKKVTMNLSGANKTAMDDINQPNFPIYRYK